MTERPDPHSTSLRLRPITCTRRDTVSKRPKNDRFSVYALTELEPGRTIWDRVGAAFINKDESITVHLRALPVTGKLQLRRGDDEEKGTDDRPPQETARDR